MSLEDHVKTKPFRKIFTFERYSSFSEDEKKKYRRIVRKDFDLSHQITYVETDEAFKERVKEMSEIYD